MSEALGTFVPGATIQKLFNTRSQASLPITLVSGVVKVYKDGGTAESAAGVTLTTDFDSVTGLHLVVIDTSADSVFYAASSYYTLVLTAGTVDSLSVAGTTLASFSLVAVQTFSAPLPGAGPTPSAFSFLDLAAELAGTLPGLSPALAESYITRAWLDICRERLWSFLVFDTVLICPTAITAGTITVTHGSTSVTANAAATTALLAQTSPALTDLQLRVSGGPVYGIAAAAPPSLTLDRVYQGTSAAGASYQVYRAWVQQPVSDFLSWESLVDHANDTTISGPRATRNRREFDRRDPQRSSQGTAIEIGHYRGDPLWELWPHPTDGQTFLATYRSRGQTPDYTDATSAPPDLIPPSLVLQRALAWYGYPWAHANKGTHPRYRGTDLLSLIVNGQRTYQLDLARAKKADDEHGLQTVYNRGWRGHARPSLQGVVGDAKYWQSHPIRW